MAEDNTGLTTGLTYECGSIKIANNFDVSVTRPLDIRLVVKNVESLYDTNVMKSPYKGMLVNIEGTSDVYVYTGAYKDKKGIIHDGVNGVKYPENWSKISTVEQFDDNIFKEEEYTDFDLENFKNVMEKQLHNPSIGLLGHVRDTSKIYVLVNKDYKSPGSWKRVGGVMEEFSVPVFIDNNNDNNDTTRKNANNSPHNTFSNNDRNPTTWVKINTSKSPESISTFGGVEMVTTEMLNNVTDEIYEKIEDVEDNLNIKIENNDIKINDRINDVIDIHNEDVKDINDYVEHEIDRVDKTISDNDKNINDKLNSTENEIYRHVNDVVENINKSIENVDEYHTLENERLEDKVDEVQDKLDMSIDDINQKIGELLKKHDDDIEKTVDELTTYINRLKNLILHGTIEDSDGMIHPSDDEKIDIEGTLKSIHYISAWLEDHKEEYNKLVEIHNKDKEGLEGLIGKLREDLNKFKGDTETAIEEALYYDTKTIDDNREGAVPWKTIEIGGIKENLTREYFETHKKTLSQMITDLIFPTLQPKFTNPSTQFNYNNRIVKIGEYRFPTENELKSEPITKCDRGKSDYDKFYAGEVSNIEISINNGGVFGELSEEKKYTITQSITFGDGEVLHDNKGGLSDPNIQYKSSQIKKTSTISSVYPIWMNYLKIDDVIEYNTLIDYHSNSSFRINIPAENGELKIVFEIHVPKSVGKPNVKQWDSYNKDFLINWDLELKGEIEHNGILYDMYTRKMDANGTYGATEYKITLNKK